MKNSETNLPGEIWKQVPGYQDYDVSNMGRVRSNKYGRTKMLKLNLVGPKRAQYLAVTMLSNEERAVPRKVHLIVLETFVGTRPDGLISRHLNGNPHDNRLENLAYGTHRENYDDAVKHGTAYKAPRLNWQKVAFIRALRKQGMPVKELSSMFNVSASLISRITTGKVWVEAK
ncbi:HNH endonuclease [Amycolatopsis sp. lyj-112]|uniref:HNH endonuclease n=1 Tax=Amycolatopsis sp. lyj-112 TaxID=2789288 RepID=UPI00397978B6